MSHPDVDIDFADREQVLRLLEHVPAMQVMQNGTKQKHKTGVYFHPVPVNPYTSWCDVDYQTAEELGFFKVDLLNVSLYQKVKSKEHLTSLTEREPIWELLQVDDFVNLLFHLNGHGDILRKTCPSSVEQLAAVLAMIRPAKRYLVGKSWTMIMKEVWNKPENGEYYFKKSHATAYAVAIVAQMNLICEELNSSSVQD
jgi:DNA polymerase III alpha subunit